MSKPAEVLAKASALEGKLKGNLFLGGARPTADDVKAFNDLLGDKNANLFRWVKHMASFTEAERAAWGAAGKKLGESKKEEPKKEEPKKEAPKAAAAAAPAKEEPKKAAAAADDDIDLFGEETEEEKAAMEAKKKADAEKKAAKKEKAPVIAKSSILLDVKVWDDSVDLEALAQKIKSNERDGLLWGAHKQAEVAYGMKKLQLLLVIEDDKVASDDIDDIIMSYDEEVQSIDIVAWNKL